MYLKPIIGFVKISEQWIFRVYLINPTDINYSQVSLVTGAFQGDEEGLVQSKEVTKVLSPLKAHSSLLLDESDLNELDLTIWYNIDLHHMQKDMTDKFTFSLPKYPRDKEVADIPILEKRGWILEMKDRSNIN